MTIPEQAVEAAALALAGGDHILQRDFLDGARIALEAAQPLMGVQRPEDVIEKCAQIVEHYTRDASFDDSVIGAGEHTANQINIANAIRQLALPGQPQEGEIGDRLCAMAKAVPLGYACRSCGSSAHNWLARIGDYLRTGNACCPEMSDWIVRAKLDPPAPPHIAEQETQ